MHESKSSGAQNIALALGNNLSRRSFLKILMMTGAAAALPGTGLLRSFSQEGPVFGRATFAGPGAYQTFRNACPRNCYDTCGIVSYVKDGVLEFVEGEPTSTYTNGGLCVKGYAYPRTVYSPDRIKYPMRQVGRGSGNWERISWEEALDAISGKILEIKEKDGSLLGMALTKYSGNFGITHYGVEGMLSSLGYTHRSGTPRASSARRAGRPASTPRTTTWATCGATTRRTWPNPSTSSSGALTPPTARCTRSSTSMKPRSAAPRSW